MKKFKHVLIFICFAAVCLLCGCGGCSLNINGRDRAYYYEPYDDGECLSYNIMPYTYTNYALKINKTTGEIFLEESGSKTDETQEKKYPEVLRGGDFHWSENVCAEGYEALPALLTEMYEHGKAKFSQFYAVECGSVAYGFCNVYSGQGGMLFSGGHVDAGKIVGSHFFSYDKARNELTDISYLNKCNIVAFGFGYKIIYFKNENYYAYDCATGEEKFICKDVAYDKGMTNYGHVTFLFNENLCIILMRHGATNPNKEYEKVVVCDYNGAVLFTDKWMTSEFFIQ